MATFVMFGDYSADALDGIGGDRTQKAVELIKRFGGEAIGMYALMGERDLMLILELPGIEEAVKVSVGLSKLTGISFSTYPAVPVDDFDRMVG